MKHFSHHERCPSCAERGDDSQGDNLGVWQDGHKFCFKCGHHESAEGGSLSNIADRLEKQQKKETPKSGIVSLPVDFDTVLPPVAVDWLSQYELTAKEISDNHIGWSNEDHSLVYPVFDSYGNLLMVQRRRFIKGRARFHTSGFPEDVFHILGNTSNSVRVVVVEDLVSAIKVARVAPSLPLWGSNISAKRAHKLSQVFDELVIWLDADKAEYAMRKRVALAPFFGRVSTKVTEQDPKKYSTSEIKEILK